MPFLGKIMKKEIKKIKRWEDFYSRKPMEGDIGEIPTKVAIIKMLNYLAEEIEKLKYEKRN